jgi:hypothetical protein
MLEGVVAAIKEQNIFFKRRLRATGHDCQTRIGGLLD